MKIYNFDDENPIMDFYSTDPPVFRIIVGPQPNHTGIFAEAFFRGGHGSHLESVATWGADEKLAIETLLRELRNRYTTPTEFFDPTEKPDPRAGLRRCEVWDRPGYYHGRDDGGDRVEFENGECVCIGWSLLKFTDIPEPSND